MLVIIVSLVGFLCEKSYTSNRKCLSVPCYFLSPCDKRKHTVHANQQAASQASMDSACRHPVWLPHSSLGFQRPVGHRSYHNKPRLSITQTDATSHNRVKHDCGLYC